MIKRIALVSFLAVALAVVPAALAARQADPAPSKPVPAGLAAKLKLQKLKAQTFTRTFVVKCKPAATTTPSGPIVTNPVCTKTGEKIVGALQKLDAQIQAKLGTLQSGDKEATRLQKLEAQLQKVLAHLQAVVGATTSATTSGGSANP